MGNRKNRHNINAVRVTKSINSDLNGYDKMFKFKVFSGTYTLGSGSTGVVEILDLFGDNSGNNTEELQFNYEVQDLNGNKLGSFDHNNVSINDINDDYSAPAVVTGINSGEIPVAEDFVIVYIKGQFNQIRIFEGGQQPVFGSTSSADGDVIGDYVAEIMQWGNINVNKNWERFMKDADGDQITVSATDEPVFADGISLNRAFEDTVNNVFTADALKAVNGWDSNKFGNGGRVFENGSDQPNFDMWTQNGGAASYAYYMRNDMSGLTNGGANMIPKNIAGWAGYASDAFSDSFQGAAGIHNWENLNTSQCVDMQYFAWKNTRAKSLGNMRNFSTSKVTNFTAMFGYTGSDTYGAEGELLVDPSNWDMKSATTLFYMFGMEDNLPSNWNGELNWKTMGNVIDLHSVVKNRTSYTGERLDEFAKHSGNVVLFRSAFAKTDIDYDFSNWNFSGVDARRTDVQLNENNSSGIMGGFVRDCANMSLTNLVKLLEACDRPFGQGGLPVAGVDPEIGTSTPNSFEFGTSYGDNITFGNYAAEQAADPTLMTRGDAAYTSLQAKGYTMGGLETVFV